MLTNPITLMTTTLLIKKCLNFTLCAVFYLNQQQTTTKGLTNFFTSNSGAITINVYIINSAGANGQIGTCLGLIQIQSTSSMFISFDFTPNTPFILIITLNITQTYISHP